MPAALNGSGSIGVGISGMPIGSTVNMRLTAVYEFIPSPNLNLVIPESSADVSNNTTQQVISKLDKTKKNWAYEVGEGITNAAMGAASAWNARHGEALIGN